MSLILALRRWLPSPSGEEAEGTLLLALANLGALLEGSLKLLLSVYYEAYSADLDAIRSRGQLRDPDGLTLEPLKQFIRRKRLLPDELLDFIDLIQQRRNSIHAFSDRPLGTGEDFAVAVHTYLQLLRTVNGRLPYPDDHFVPRD